MAKKYSSHLIILAGCMWGTISLFVLFFERMQIYDNITKLFVFYFGATVIIVTLVLFYDKSLLVIKLKDFWIFFLAGAVCVFGFEVAFYYNIVHTSANFALVMLYTSPIWVMVISSLFLEEKITTKKIIALVCGVLGCTLVSGLIGGMANFSVVGFLLGLLSGFGYGMYTIISTIAIKKGYNSLTINAWTFTMVTVSCLIFGVRFDQLGYAISSSPAFSIIYMLAFSIFCSAIPYALYTMGLRYVEPGRAAIMASCDPVVGTISAMIIFNQYPSIYSWFGMALVICALVFIQDPCERSPSK